MALQGSLLFTALFVSILNPSSAQDTYFMSINPDERANSHASTNSQRGTDGALELESHDLIVDLPKHRDGHEDRDLDFVDAPITPEAHTAMLTYLARARRTRDEPDFPEGLTCDICEFLVGKIRSLVAAEHTLEELLAGISEACAFTDLVNRGICRMIVHEYQDQIIYIFNHLVLSPGEVCGLILGDGCATPYFPGHMWSVKLPATPKPPPKTPKIPKPHAPKLRVLQLTDIHLDPQYEPGTKAACRDPLCCRDSSQNEDILELFTKSDPLTSKIAGKYGDYGSCDCPIATAENLFKHLRSIQDQYDYILFTGDIPPHDVWNQTQTDQKASIRVLDRLFRKYLPDKPLFQAVGNHESAPCNSFPPPGIPNHNSSWLFDTLADVWGRWLPRAQLHTVAKCGSYSHSPYPGFRIISVNNNYCNTLNFWLVLNATDPCGTLQWLISELQSAEDKDEKVHLVLHIPPGVSNCMKAWSWNFYRIVNRYENTVVNQFYGHQHRDYFQIFLDDTHFKRATGVGFAAPSVTPYSSTNPTFRIYTIDGNYTDSSWAVLDFTTFYLNITEANHSGRLNWQPEYSARKDLNMKSLYAADWKDLIDRMETDDVLFQRFFRYYQALHTDGPCSGECKSDLLCELREGRSYDPKLCPEKFH